LIQLFMMIEVGHLEVHNLDWRTTKQAKKLLCFKW